jgi:hypothetical protein
MIWNIRNNSNLAPLGQPLDMMSAQDKRERGAAE